MASASGRKFVSGKVRSRAGGATRLVLTCEHGGREVPRAYRKAFAGAARILESHRGYDRGALEMAKGLAKGLDAPLFAATVTRLLVDLNRSAHHLRLWSEFSRPLDAGVRAQIMAELYEPHRERVRAQVAKRIDEGHRVLHVAVHSFVPSLDGEVRTADVGLLFDPGRPWEAQLCGQWTHRLKGPPLDLRVRRNYPYRGVADGLTRWLRTCFDARAYAGIELEINQAWVGGPGWRALNEWVRVSLASLL